LVVKAEIKIPCQLIVINKVDYLEVVTKNFQTNDLIAVQNRLKKVDIKMIFSDLKYNSSNEIVKLSIELKQGNKRLHASWEDDNPIPNIEIGILQNRLILNSVIYNRRIDDSINSQEQINKSKGYFKSSDGDDHYEDDLFRYRKSNKNRIHNNTTIKYKNGFAIKNISKNKSLFVVNGKIVKSSSIDSMLAENIEHVNILKGKKATIKYGDKGKNGVIEITTKNNKKQKK
tara:strand:+ start:50187 stop:50876 length:690 start_codon:yes stop_codon:yes gene_type:complete